jgi:UDPglucose 6-dehydrogenase
MKIHYINEMADFCEKAGADIFEVAKGMGLDSRIGSRFLNPGPGYGGSCFPKDTNAMAYMGRKYGANLSLIESTIRGNDLRKTQMASRVLKSVEGVANSKIAVWGLAFKDGTDDVRESPAMQIVEQLLKNNANLCVYDPKAMDNAKKILGDKVEYASSMMEAVKGADVVAVLTEWKEFSEVDLSELKACMKNYKIVDLRNMLKNKNPEKEGSEYQCIGAN